MAWVGLLTCRLCVAMCKETDKTDEHKAQNRDTLDFASGEGPEQHDYTSFFIYTYVSLYTWRILSSATKYSVWKLKLNYSNNHHTMWAIIQEIIFYSPFPYSQSIQNFRGYEEAYKGHKATQISHRKLGWDSDELLHTPLSIMMKVIRHFYDVDLKPKRHRYAFNVILPATTWWCQVYSIFST